MIKNILHGICHLVYPPRCPVCKKNLSPSSKEVLCLKCLHSIRFNLPPFCPKCSRHLGKIRASPYCGDCRKHLPQFDFAWSACLYEGPLKDLIHKFKYSQKTGLRLLFIRLMRDFIQRYYLDIAQFDLIVPVPLHPTRLRERGYNQSQLLAKGICGTFHIPLSTNLLSRTRHTRHQALLDEKERWTNIHGAFTIKSSCGLKKKNVLIIDDLMTTGATVSEAAKTLKDFGAETVGVLTLAITL